MLTDESAAADRQTDFVQMGLFTDYEALEKQRQEDEKSRKKNHESARHPQSASGLATQKILPKKLPFVF